jgi:hypothetical protein
MATHTGLWPVWGTEQTHRRGVSILKASCDTRRIQESTLFMTENTPMHEPSLLMDS